MTQGWALSNRRYSKTYWAAWMSNLPALTIASASRSMDWFSRECPICVMNPFSNWYNLITMLIDGHSVTSSTLVKQPLSSLAKSADSKIDSWGREIECLRQRNNRWKQRIQLCVRNQKKDYNHRWRDRSERVCDRHLDRIISKCSRRRL